MKKLNKTLILTVVMCLIPIIFGVLVYDKLPDTMATQWSFDNTPSNFSSKAFAVFGMPIILACLNVIVQSRLNVDPKMKVYPNGLKLLMIWLIPAISLIFEPITILYGLGTEVNIKVVIGLLLGIIFIIFGNYMPKCRQNCYMGIRVPWTLKSEVVWKKTHHMAGYLWIFAGVCILICTFFGRLDKVFEIIIAAVVIPLAYSFVLSLREKEK